MKQFSVFVIALLLGSAPHAQEAPPWFPKAPPLPPPAGKVIRAATAEEILAAENLAPGETMLIEAGEYTMPRVMVLRARKDIIIRSVSGDPASVTLKGKGWDAGDQRDDILHVGDCDGVLIAGITFAEARSYGVKVEAERAPKSVRIYNCRFRNIGVRAIKGSAGNDPNVRAIRGSVRFCDFENTRVPPAEWLYGGDYIAAIDMMALQDWTFTDNVFRNIKGRNGGGRAAIFVWVRSRRIVVERNLIVNCDRGISFGNPGQSTANNKGELVTYVSDGVIQNNMISGGADCGIELWYAEGIKVRHNSIWRPERNWGRGIRVGTGARAELANNLIHGGIQIEGGQAQEENNVAKRLDDHFVNPVIGDLSLTRAAGEAINRGIVLNETPYDIAGNHRRRESDLGASELGGNRNYWIEPMRKVHARFKGTNGSCAQFGDSITFSSAYWSPLAMQPKDMSAPVEASYQLVKQRLKPESFHQKGLSFGNQGSMTIRWAQENISKWLADLNPEIAVIMFGSNDVGQMSLDEYEKGVREGVRKCLANGTIPILTTPPPQTARLQKSLDFAAAVRRIALEENVPLIDYSHEILQRRPFDWDGASADFKEVPGDTYEVPTLISRDGIHPSNSKAAFNNFSDEALAANGFTLRNYLTLQTLSDVLRNLQN